MSWSITLPPRETRSRLAGRRVAAGTVAGVGGDYSRDFAAVAPAC